MSRPRRDRQPRPGDRHHDLWLQAENEIATDLIHLDIQSSQRWSKMTSRELEHDWGAPRGCGFGFRNRVLGPDGWSDATKRAVMALLGVLDRSAFKRWQIKSKRGCLVNKNRSEFDKLWSSLPQDWEDLVISVAR